MKREQGSRAGTGTVLSGEAHHSIHRPVRIEFRGSFSIVEVDALVVPVLAVPVATIASAEDSADRDRVDISQVGAEALESAP
jgi:hypothetical protein